MIHTQVTVAAHYEEKFTKLEHLDLQREVEILRAIIKGGDINSTSVAKIFALTQISYTRAQTGNSLNENEEGQWEDRLNGLGDLVVEAFECSVRKSGLEAYEANALFGNFMELENLRYIDTTLSEKMLSILAEFIPTFHPDSTLGCGRAAICVTFLLKMKAYGLAESLQQQLCRTTEKLLGGHCEDTMAEEALLLVRIEIQQRKWDDAKALVEKLGVKMCEDGAEAKDERHYCGRWGRE